MRMQGRAGTFRILSSNVAPSEDRRANAVARNLCAEKMTGLTGGLEPDALRTDMGLEGGHVHPMSVAVRDAFVNRTRAEYKPPSSR